MGDCKYAWRRLSTNWRSSIVIVAMLAIGIGVNTAMYTVIRSVLFARPGVQAPERLIYIYATGRDRKVDFVSFREFLSFRRSQRVFLDVVAAATDRGFLRTSANADDEEMLGEMVSANYFRVLGIHPIVGRAFNVGADDDFAEDEAVVVISEHLWRTRFNADPRAIGEHLTIGSRSYTVIGVAPSSFNGVAEPWRSYEYWVPAIQRSEDLRCDWPDPLRLGMFLVVGRLDDDAGTDRTALGVRSLAGQLQREFHPTQPDWSLIVRASRLSPFVFLGGGARVLPSYLAFALFAVTAMVLLVAMTNVCGLILADGISRRSEIAIRFALGGSRWRIAREIVVEMLWLSSIGGVLALPIASALVATYVSVSGGGIAARMTGMSIPINGSSFAFTFALCTAVGLAVGLVAVLQLPRRNLTTCLVGNVMTIPRDVARTLRYVVLTPQVCVAAALLLAAGTFGRAAVRASGFDYGERLANLVFVNIELPIAGRCERSAAAIGEYAERRRLFARTVLKQAEGSVTLGSLAVTNTRPFEPARAYVTTRSKDALIVRVSRADVSSTYFDTVGIPMLRGRTFDIHDSTTAPRVAVVCEALAHLLWGDENPIGQYVAFNDRDSALPPKWMTVVGVVREVKTPLGDGERNPTIYLPLEQGTYGRSVLARADGDFATTIGRVRTMVRRTNADVHIVKSGTVRSELDQILYARRLAAVLLGGCGLSGLLLAGIGLHGAVSYAVARRTREMGVRLALGATRHEIVQLVMRDSVLAATFGLGGGVMLALAFVRVLSATIWPIHDSGTTVAIATLLPLLIVVLLACYVPARRVTSIDPVEVLREL